MKHIYKKQGKYYLLDMNEMKFYKIPKEFYLELDSMDEKQLDEFGQKIFSKSNTNTFMKVQEQDNNKCERLILNLSESCNLACHYCYAEEGSYGQEQKTNIMSLETVKDVVKRTYELYPKGITTIQFFGGEPLLNKDVMREAVKWINIYVDKLNIDKPLFTMVTNGTLIEDEDIMFFNEYFASITISLDGNKEINDYNRVFKNNKGSVYETVASKIRRMDELGRKFYLAIEGTINRKHIIEFKKSGKMEALEALKELNADIIHISPLIESDSCKSCVSSESLTDLNKIDVLNFFDSWIEEEISSGIDKIRLRVAASVLLAAKKHETFGNGCGASNTDIASDVRGILYPCFMFIGEKEFDLGHAASDLETQKSRLLEVRQKLRIANENDTCNNCWVKPICKKSYGHCIGARYLSTKKIDKPAELICDISKIVLENIFTLAMENYSVKSKVRES
ncbi:MAG: radical SAM protein [Clostridium sp.]|uniref:radical SAM/SPASM domain-containing protein n=1 Tax=Clostridium sp. DSM 8431 TaxID=1761781 RepID=UPI0008E275D9|nr:radical SAM protein [Clostridium sp. DSM 8431]MCR4945177.1 radical SAM protein [Clostridium sp.]SFU34639.1 4Fe-4S single cluster domain-containing protein [Clostridium sp. DSM 8431]